MTRIYNAHMPDPDDPELATTLRSSFDGRVAVNMTELGNILKLDDKTLLKHIRSGKLPFRAVGTGRHRMRRMFTMGDVVHFFANLKVSVTTRPATRSVAPPLVAAPGLIGFVPRPVRRKEGAVAGSSAPPRYRKVG